MKKGILRKVLYILAVMLFVTSVVLAVLDLMDLGIIMMVAGFLLLIGNGIAGLIIASKDSSEDNIIKEIAQQQTDDLAERKRIEDEIKTITQANAIRTDDVKTDSAKTGIYRIITKDDDKS